MTDLEVRPASSNDAEGLEPLLADALARLESLRGGDALLASLGVPRGTDAASMASALSADALLGVSTLVATMDGAVVGLAVLVRSTEGVDLAGVHTARSLRRRRIGSTLLEAARAVAAAADDRFEALALPGDQTVKSLLEAAGFKARLLRMSADR